MGKCKREDEMLDGDDPRGIHAVKFVEQWSRELNRGLS